MDYYKVREHLVEGYYIEGVGCTKSVEYYEFSGVIFRSLGLIINSTGNCTQIPDVIEYDILREATEDEIKTALDAFDCNFVFNDSEDAEIAREYINSQPDEKILPLKFKKFSSREELLKAIDKAMVLK